MRRELSQLINNRDRPKVDLEKFTNICFSPSLLIFNNSYDVGIKIGVRYKQLMWSYCQVLTKQLQSEFLNFLIIFVLLYICEEFSQALFLCEGVNLLNEEIGAEGEVLVPLSYIVRNPEMPKLCPGTLFLSLRSREGTVCKEQQPVGLRVPVKEAVPTSNTPVQNSLKNRIGHTVQASALSKDSCSPSPTPTQRHLIIILGPAC